MSAWFTFEKCFKAQDFRWRMCHPLPVGVLQPVNLHFGATKLLLVSAWCLQLPLSLSLYFDTVASRRSTHSANFPWAFLRNSSSLQHKKNKWYKWYKWYKKSLEVSFVHQHSFNRQVSVGPGCRKHGTWVALPNLPNLIEKNLAILGDQATFRLILRSLPTHDEIVRIYLWVIAVDLYVYCGFLWHLNELECWNSGRKLPRAVGSLMFSVSCHNHASMAGCPQCQVCQVFKHF